MLDQRQDERKYKGLKHLNKTWLIKRNKTLKNIRTKAEFSRAPKKLHPPSCPCFQEWIASRVLVTNQITAFAVVY